MNGKCEVIGWLLDGGEARRFVRENGSTAFENVCVDESFGGIAIQTGTFRRGKPIIDRVTQQCVGYEMEAMQAIR